MAPSSPNVSAPSSASTLPTTQTSSATPRSLPDCRNTAPGTRKMPEPIVVPTTMSTRSRRPRTRRSSPGIGSGCADLQSRRHCGGGVARRGLAPDIGRPHACRERLPHRPLQVAPRLRVAQVLEQQRARENGRDGIRHTLAGERRGRAVHRLQQARLALPREPGGGRSHPPPPPLPRPQIGEGVAVPVVLDDHPETPPPP